MAKPLGGYTARQLDHILSTGSLEELAAATKTPLATNPPAARRKTPTAPTDRTPAKAPADDTSAGKTPPATTDGVPRALPRKADSLDPRGTRDGRLLEIAGDRYIQYPDFRAPDGRELPAELRAITEKGGDIKLLRGALDVSDMRTVRDITPGLRPGDVVDTLARVSYTSPEGDRTEITYTGTDAGEARPTWPQRLNISLRTATRKFTYIGSAIKALAVDWANRNNGVRQAYASTGLLFTEAGPQYLRIGAPALTADGYDPNSIVHLASGVDGRLGHLAMPDPSSDAEAVSDFWELIKVLDLVPAQPAVPLALLSQLAWAPWANKYGMVSLIVAGGTGSRKSAMAGVIMATQSRTEVYGPGQEPRATAKMRHGASSPIGIDRALYPLGGMVGLIDDAFATKATAQEYGAQWRTLSLIGDNTATQSGSAKGAREAGSMRPEEYPRACLLVTAERLPGESDHGSEVARYVAFTLSAPVDLDALSAAQSESATRARGRAHAAMIQAGLADIEAPARALAWAGEQADSWGNVGHGRAKIGYTTLLAGARLLAEGAVQLQMAESADQFMESLGAVELLRVACEDQARRAGTVSGRPATSDYVGVFCRTVRDMLSEQALWIADGAHADSGHRPPAATCVAGPGALGWRQSAVSGEALTAYDNGVTWQPGRGAPVGGYLGAEDHGRPTATGFAHALHVPSRSWSDVMAKVGDAAVRLTGWSLVGPDEMLALLVKAGIAASSDPTRPRLFGTQLRCYTFDLARLLGADDDQGDEDGSPEPDSGPEPGPETPALWIDRSEGDQGDQSDQDNWSDLDAPPANPVDDALVADFQLGGPELPCVFCAEPTTGHLYGRPAHMTCALDAQPGDAHLAVATVTETTTPIVGRKSATKATARPRRRSPDLSRIGALDSDGLWTSPDAQPLPVQFGELSNVADLVALMERRNLRTLYLAPGALVALGLERPELDGGPEAGHPHPWTTLPEGSDISLTPDGLAAWMTVKGETSPGRMIAVPSWDAGRRVFPGANDGRSLLAAVQLLTRSLGESYYRSPNRTAEALFRSHTKANPYSQAIYTQRVPPVDEYETGLDTSWSRTLQGSETSDKYLHEFDVNTAYLLAFNTPVGLGDPTQRTVLDGDSLEFDSKLAGYWRVTGPLPSFDPRLPTIEYQEASSGGAWLATPDMELMRSIDRRWSPCIPEAWVWPTTSRVLDSTGRAYRLSREKILEAVNAGDPGATAAKSLHGMLYKSWVGALGMKVGPPVDQQTGKIWPAGRAWRPDWQHMIIAASQANLYRRLMQIRDQAGRHPVGLHVDCVAYTSINSDATKGRPVGIQIGTGGTEWKIEATAPLNALTELITNTDNDMTWHRASAIYRKGN